MVELNSIEMLGFVLYRKNVSVKRFLEVLDRIRSKVTHTLFCR